MHHPQYIILNLMFQQLKHVIRETKNNVSYKKIVPAEFPVMSMRSTRIRENLKYFPSRLIFVLENPSIKPTTLLSVSVYSYALPTQYNTKVCCAQVARKRSITVLSIATRVIFFFSPFDDIYISSDKEGNTM